MSLLTSLSPRRGLRAIRLEINLTEGPFNFPKGQKAKIPRTMGISASRSRHLLVRPLIHVVRQGVIIFDLDSSLSKKKDCD